MMRFIFLIGLLFCIILTEKISAQTSLVPYSPPPLPIARTLSPAILTAFGDSTEQNGCVNVPQTAQFPNTSQPNYVVGFEQTCSEGWLQAFADGALFADPTQGYSGSVGGLIRVVTTTQGSCTASATLTFQPSAPTGSPANTAGTFTVAFDSNGHAAVGQNIALASPGSGYTAPPTYTVTGGSCTTQPSFAYIISGTANYGVSGDRTQWMIYRVADVCASTADIVMYSGFVNDLFFAVPVATIKANIATIVSNLQACGKRVLLEAVTPVTSGTAGWNTTMDTQRLDINAYERQLCQQAASLAPSPQYATLACADASKYWSDATSATGSPLSTVTQDGIHASVSGAQYRALVDLAAIKPWLGNGKYRPNDQQDVYNATNNPYGNQLGVAAALFTGSGGSIGSCATGGGSCTGTLATGWTSDWSGTGAMTGTFSQETTRTDGLSGQRQIVTLSDVGGGATDRIRVFVSISKVNFTVGTDSMSGGFFIDVSNVTGAVEVIGCQIGETPTAGNNQQAVNFLSGALSASYPVITSAQMARLQEAKSLPDFGLTASGSYRQNCEIPTFLTQSDASSYTMYVYVIGSGAWTATLKLSEASARKNTP